LLSSNDIGLISKAFISTFGAVSDSFFLSFSGYESGALTVESGFLSVVFFGLRGSSLATGSSAGKGTLLFVAG